MISECSTARAWCYEHRLRVLGLPQETVNRSEADRIRKTGSLRAPGQMEATGVFGCEHESYGKWLENNSVQPERATGGKRGREPARQVACSVFAGFLLQFYCSTVQPKGQHDTLTCVADAAPTRNEDV